MYRYDEFDAAFVGARGLRDQRGGANSEPCESGRRAEASMNIDPHAVAPQDRTLRSRTL